LDFGDVTGGVARVYTPKDFDLTQIMREIVDVAEGASGGKGSSVFKKDNACVDRCFVRTYSEHSRMYLDATDFDERPSFWRKLD
jgi:hypothetical protein